ncbi:hypothetical protein GYMLUDRAFT_917613 [Collybiopsis luxurians FD-317 M1]|uniref:Uncharacterized protein n=1 Tax=Collybiopsis luxurians FD-317 M1 TaxID=944289 RepID=A0A0D0C896_9AGAR|nr:hypothetical protein GYMLUDRAFT_917613 [Collybiopsis luxurians FD-317 M1]
MADEVSEAFQGVRPLVDSLIFQFLFYGASLILGAVYISLQLQQRRSQSQKKFQHPFYPTSLAALYILATAGIIVSVYDVENIIQEFMFVLAVEQNPIHRLELTVKYRTAIGSLFTTANWVADAILIYRCYHVWNGRLWVPVIPGVLSIIYTGIAFASVATIKIGSPEQITTNHSHEVEVGDRLDYIFLGINAFNNVLLTALIAGRIWWLSRVHSRLLKAEGSDKRLNAIVSIFVESGTLYPVALIICLIIQAKGSTATMDPILLQIVGIAPTLIMVRTSLGLGVDGRSPHQDTGVELGNAFSSTRVISDVKDTIHSSASSPYQPTFTLPSDYLSTPLQSPRSVHSGGGSIYSSNIGHGNFQTMSLTNTGTEGTKPSYDKHTEMADGTGFRPEKMFAELRPPPSLQSTPTQTLFYSGNGTSSEPSSSRSAHFKDSDRLQPLRYSTNQA